MASKPSPRQSQRKTPPAPATRPSAPRRPSDRDATRSAHPAPRVSARQALQHRRQRNIYLAIGSVFVVVLLVAVGLAVKFAGNHTTALPPVADDFAVAASSVVQVEGVPLDTLVAAAVAKSNGSTKPQVLPAKTKPLTLDGKPEILYIGAEYCPYCAAERWAMVMALSKFGTFTGLQGTTSSATETENPSTPTFTFYGSSYSSPYISFVPVETNTNSVDSATKYYGTLQNMSSQQSALLAKWDTAPYTTQTGAIPFLYMGGRDLEIGAQYLDSPLAGMQFTKAVSYLTASHNPTQRSLDAAAGYLVGDICALTHNKPAAVCSQVPATLKSK